mgnify:CR=1 FL=1
MHKRWTLLLVAGVVLVLLVVYPWIGCSVDRNQVQVSLIRPWVVTRLDGSAVGFVLNVTNYSGCDLHLTAVSVTVHSATYRDGSMDVFEFTQTQDVSTVISGGHAEQVDYTFDNLFPLSPAKLALRVEISFRETGAIVVFDGEIEIPSR